MFRQGKPRAFIHNLRLASLLSFVAGVVNIAGLMSVYTLTTNVTGHFAFFSREFVLGNYQTALDYVSYIAAFLIGAFICGFLVELVLRRQPSISHALPMILEIITLAVVSLTAKSLLSDEWVARLLLFAMGLQNALVTKVSQATVRTTHLTGLFTDLGIEFSQLFFYREKTESRKLSSSIYLRIAIIVCFFFGGVCGGFLFDRIGLNTFLVAAGFLLIAFIYDNIRLLFHYYRRRLQSEFLRK